MIALCTSTPVFTDAGENTLLTFPSGDGEPIRIVLTRNQLCLLAMHSQIARTDAFAKPQPEMAELVPMTAKAVGGAN
ncbi:hypothetical protein GCM10023115_19320 [Pontixanthobacter gangjinensis]|uniref:Uncharacterized protein n=1 Tax=Pontixanthobacter gangjinensis TaxID=1028742 RepID=A0A6I4SRP5_9SPHN|nr:hypothetical protein [Pontixanthobacter gangjinensis]MXO57182.1 hypothetical protein [Pontixanthobacter gangjinensis]